MKHKFLFLGAILLLLSLSSKAQQKHVKYGKINLNNLQTNTYVKDPEANAVILFKYGNVSFVWDEKDGYKYKYDFHIRIKIINKSGFYMANVGLAYRPDYDKISSIRATTYLLENGKIAKYKVKNSDIFKEENSFYDEYKFTFPNVQEGAIIEYSYQMTSNRILDIKRWNFQDLIPVEYSEFMITIPEYLNYNHNRIGYLPISKAKVTFIPESYTVTYSSIPKAGGQIDRYTKTFNSNSERHIYYMENVPALKDEKFISNYRNYISAIDLKLERIKDFNGDFHYYASSWEKINDRLMNEVFNEYQSCPSNIAEKVKNITAGNSSNSQKIALIYDWLTANIKWNGEITMVPSKRLRTIYKDQEGNSAELNLLLLSMLKEAGINARPLILSTRDNGIINPAHPSFNDFNYVIVYARDGDNVYNLDATAAGYKPGILPKRCINGYARILGKDNTYETNIIGYNVAKYMYFVDLSLQNEVLKGTINSIFDNNAATDFKNLYLGFADKNKYIEYQEKENNGLKITSLDFDNLDNKYKPLTVKTSVEISNMIDILGNKIYFNPMLYYGISENPFKYDTRNYPIDYTHPFEITYMLKITVPEGYKIEYIPENKSISLPNKIGNFQYMANNLTNSIQIISKFSINKSIINQTSYAELKEFYSEIVKKHNEQIVFSKL